MDNERIVQIMPSDGWRAAYFRETEGSREIKVYSYPLVGWGLLDSGLVVPLDVDRSGWVEDPTEASNFVSLIPPGEEERREAGLDELAVTPAIGRVIGEDAERE